jgi:predicted esterase YcpF (UPF0227 family)
MANIIYIHGFASSGNSDKAVMLRKEFPKDNVISPTLSANPKQAIAQLHSLIMKSEPVLVIGTSLGGFYATYIACVYDVPAFIINPSLTPYIDIKRIIKTHNGKRIGSDEPYEFKTEYLDDLKDLFDKLHSTDKESYNLHFYLSSDDEVLTFDNLDTLFPNKAHVKVFDNSGHRFSKFQEIFPDVRKVLNSLNHTKS